MVFTIFGELQKVPIPHLIILHIIIILVSKG